MKKNYRVIKKENGDYDVRYICADGFVKTAVGRRTILHEYVDGHEVSRLETKAEMTKRLCECLGIEY